MDFRIPTVRSMASGLASFAALASLAAAQPSLQVTPASLTYSFNAFDAPADRTVAVKNVGTANATVSITDYLTGQPAGSAFAADAAAAAAPDAERIYSEAAYDAPFAPDRVIVGFKDGQTALSSAYNAFAAGAPDGLREIGRARHPGNGALAQGGRRFAVAKLRGKGKDAVREAIAALRQDPNVAYVQPDYVLRALDVPNDPDFAQQWHLNNGGQNGGTPDADIDAPEAWSRARSANRIVVGIIDSGIDYLHPDLIANIWTNPNEVPGNGIDDDANGYIDDVHGYDFANDDGDPMDDNMHGTHCAGIVAATGNNGIGVSGTAWQAQLMALKFLDASGSGFTSAAIAAVNYARAMGVKITSNSWGGGPFDQALMDAIAASGALFIAAAGNESADNDGVLRYPSGYNLANILTVASTDQTDNLSWFSNFGAANVDVAAPGTSIWSTTPRTATGDMIVRGVSPMYGSLSGTSMATPIVSGMAALILQLNGNLTTADVRALIQNNVDVLPALAGKCATSGRVNLDKTLSKVVPGWLTLTPTTMTLTPGQTANLNVRANPAGLAGGAWGANVVVSAPGAADKVVSVAMNIASCVTISGPANVDFGSAWTGQAVTRNLVLNNTCNSPLNITGITSANGAFSLTSAMPLRIDPFSSGIALVKFQTATSGTHNASFTVASNAGNAPSLSIPATGRALIPPRLNLTPASLSGTAAVGAQVTATLNVGNSGVSDLIASFSAAAGDNGTWLSATPASVTVPAGANVPVTVRMNAASLLGGVYSGEIRVFHNDPALASPASVPVTFTVTGTRNLRAAPASLNFSVQAVNRAAPFALRAVYDSFPEFSNLRTADMDADGDLDLVAGNDNINGSDAKVYWFENTNNHSWKFKPHVVSSKPMGGTRYFYEDVYPIDLDRDGDMDVVAAVAIPYSAGFVVWFEKTAGGYVERIVSSNIQYGSRVRPIDLDKDGDIDIASASSTDDKICWFRNNGSQSFTEVPIINTADNAIDLEAGDIDADGDIDLVSASYDDGKIRWFANNGSGAFTERLVANHQEAQHSILNDLDKDGDLDVLGAGLHGGAVWYENNGTGTFTPHIVFTGTDERWAYWIQAADMDMDGDKDLIIGSRDGLSYFTDWYENNGAGSFTAIHPIADRQERGMTPGDFDGDGDVDVAMGTFIYAADLRAPTILIYESAIAVNSAYTQLINGGTGPVSVSALTLGSNRFSTPSRTPLTVPPKDSVSVPMSYVIASGARVSTLTVASNATDNPSISVALNGADVPGIPLPGRLQAEAYKNGGQGVGYNDLTPTNQGGQFRPLDGVDIEATTDVGGGYNVGYIQTAEWLAYDVNVAATGLYTLTARLASAVAGTKTMVMTVDGGSPVTFNFTDATGWQSWKDVVLANVNLTAGPHVLRLTMNTGDFNINYLDVAAKVNQPPVANAGADRTVNANTAVTLDGRASTDPDAYPQALTYEWIEASGPAITLANPNTAQPGFTPTVTGTYVFRLTVRDGAALSQDEMTLTVTPSNPSIALPGRIQAEEYKNGGQGVGYNDLTPTNNQGGQFRPLDGVDIQATTDVGGGYNVGWTQAGEWLAYDVNVAASGQYNLTARLATGAAGTKTMSMQVDGATVATFSFADGTGYQVWKDVLVQNVNLTAGNHVVRLTMVTGDFNVNYVNVAAKANQAPIANAGADRSVNINAAVTLDGRGSSDPDAGPQALTYFWNQVSGASVILTGGNTSQPSFTPTAAGAYVFRLTVNDGAASSTDDVTVTANSGVVYVNLPAKLQAEDYRAGGQNVGYRDLTPGNTGNVYRADDMDIQATTDVGGGYNVGWTQAGEWLAYDVRVTTAGPYAFTARVASGAAGTKTITVTVDGAVAATFNFTDATGWQSWKDVVVNNVNLTAGTHVLAVNFSTANFNINYVDIAAEPPSNAILLPGRLQAEAYKAGGQGVGYNDLTPANNQGGQFRPLDGVDIEATTDVGGGYNVGWTQAGEWLAYDVRVTTTGAYRITARLASGAVGTKTIAMQVDGATVATFSFADATGWQSWKDVVLTGVNLTAGNHVVRLNLNSSDVNVNYIDVGN
jgi:subtilisin family serine protease